MKKIMILILLVICTVSFAYAETVDTTTVAEDEEARNLKILSSKIKRMKREMDTFLKDVMTTYPDQATSLVQDFGSDVKVDISQTDSDVLVKADLPGMDKDKIEITLDKNKILKISGAREVMKKETAPGMVKQERSYGKFERILELPVDCMNSGIKATYNAGVLDIIIPKMKEPRQEPTKIKVQ